MDVKQIERLEAWLRIAPDMGGCFELPEDCRDDIDALLQLARAVNESPVAELRGTEQSWKAGGSTEVKYRVLDVSYSAPQTVALVPAPVKGGNECLS